MTSRPETPSVNLSLIHIFFACWVLLDRAGLRVRNVCALHFDRLPGIRYVRGQRGRYGQQRAVQARAVDRGQHPSCPEAGTVRWWEARTGNRGRDWRCRAVGGRNYAGD